MSYTVEKDSQLIMAKKVDSEGPVAVAGPDLTCGVDEAVSLDASGSSDNIGIVGYTWSLGDGLEVAGEKVAHRYDHPGVYTVVLRVVDAAGNSAEDDLQVTVLAQEAEEEAQGLDLRLLLAPLLVALLAAAFYFFRVRGGQQI